MWTGPDPGLLPRAAQILRGKGREWHALDPEVKAQHFFFKANRDISVRFFSYLSLICKIYTEKCVSWRNCNILFFKGKRVILFLLWGFLVSVLVVHP